MTQNVAIEVDIESLKKNEHVIGNVYFVIDYHRFFPDPNWSDFIVIVLSWWIQSIKALMISDVGVTYQFVFMDGIPIVLAKKVRIDEVELQFCLEGLNKNSLEGIAQCKIEQLKESLLKTSKKVLRAMERNKWDSTEIEELKQLVKSLERY